jgi:hypothetical protein
MMWKAYEWPALGHRRKNRGDNWLCDWNWMSVVRGFDQTLDRSRALPKRRNRRIIAISKMAGVDELEQIQLLSALHRFKTTMCVELAVDAPAMRSNGGDRDHHF